MLITKSNFPALIAAALGLALLASRPAQAQQQWNCDVDDYISKAIGIEEPWLENAAYVFAQASNDRPGSLVLSPEVEARLGERVGLELDIPALTVNDPLGHAQAVAGPAGAGLKFAAIHTCEMDRGRATLLTFEAEAQQWIDPHPGELPGAGNTVAVQAMWAQLWYPWFTQGEAGYVQHVGAGPMSGWYINTSVGTNLRAGMAVQLEAEIDNESTRSDGQRGLEGSLFPQISYHVGQEWTFALGEQVSLRQGDGHLQWSTVGMVEREF